MSFASRIRLSTERFALILSQPVRALRRRVNAWIMTRIKRQPGPVAIGRRSERRVGKAQRAHRSLTRVGTAFV